jgi:hypothetical protein
VIFCLPVFPRNVLTNAAININIAARSIKMLAVKGVYENGEIKLKEKVSISGEIPVIITFLEDIEKQEIQKPDINKFSFKRSKELLKDYKGSLSDAVIEERRSFV